MSKFVISELPTVENTSFIEKEAKKIVKKSPTKVKGTTSVLKVILNGDPFYHFASKEFDTELATKAQSAVIGGKTFYLGLKNNSMHTKRRLVSLK